MPNKVLYDSQYGNYLADEDGNFIRDLEKGYNATPEQDGIAYPEPDGINIFSTDPSSPYYREPTGTQRSISGGIRFDPDLLDKFIKGGGSLIAAILAGQLGVPGMPFGGGGGDDDDTHPTDPAGEIGGGGGGGGNWLWDLITDNPKETVGAAGGLLQYLSNRERNEVMNRLVGMQEESLAYDIEQKKQTWESLAPIREKATPYFESIMGGANPQMDFLRKYMGAPAQGGVTFNEPSRGQVYTGDDSYDNIDASISGAGTISADQPFIDSFGMETWNTFSEEQKNQIRTDMAGITAPGGDGLPTSLVKPGGIGDPEPPPVGTPQGQGFDMSLLTQGLDPTRTSGDFKGMFDNLLKQALGRKLFEAKPFQASPMANYSLLGNQSPPGGINNQSPIGGGQPPPSGGTTPQGTITPPVDGIEPPPLSRWNYLDPVTTNPPSGGGNLPLDSGGGANLPPSGYIPSTGGNPPPGRTVPIPPANKTDNPLAILWQQILDRRYQGGA